MVIQESEVIAVQEHPEGATTLKLPEPPAAATLPSAGFTAYVQGGGAATVSVTETESSRFAVPGARTPRNPAYVPRETPVRLRLRLAVAGVVPVEVESVAPGMPLTARPNGQLPLVALTETVTEGLGDDCTWYT